MGPEPGKWGSEFDNTPLLADMTAPTMPAEPSVT
jgi:hypothetical protein